MPSGKILAGHITGFKKSLIAFTLLSCYQSCLDLVNLTMYDRVYPSFQRLCTLLLVYKSPCTQKRELIYLEWIHDLEVTANLSIKRITCNCVFIDINILSINLIFSMLLISRVSNYVLRLHKVYDLKDMKFCY